MTLHCNICSQEIDEKEIENHINTMQHKKNKSNISKTNERDSGNSVVKKWQDSLKE
jgi:hypothetical protein